MLSGLLQDKWTGPRDLTLATTDMISWGIYCVDTAPSTCTSGRAINSLFDTVLSLTISDVSCSLEVSPSLGRAFPLAWALPSR